MVIADNLKNQLSDILDKSERLKNKRFKIKKALIDELYIKLGLDLEVSEEFERFSNTLLRRMIEELEEKENK